MWVAVVGAIAYFTFAFFVTASRAERASSVEVWVRWGIATADAAVLVVLVGITGTAYPPALMLAGILLSIRFAVLTGTTSQRAAEAVAGRARAEAEARAEHRRLEQERSLRQRLEALEQARRDFLHAVVHDFRTPVTSLEGLARVLRNQPGLDDEQRRHALQLIENHAHHVASLLVSVREVALTESLGPDRSLSLSDVFCSEMVNNAAASVGLPAERLRVLIDPALTVIRTDADKMQRILTNLLENASRHAPPDSRIDVEFLRRDNSIELSVLDRGPGMPDEVAGKAFDKFFGFGERRGSSGLGMWIVAQLAEALGGRVEASQRAGGGLVVRVTQPLIAPARRSRGGQGVGPVPDGRGP